MNRALILALLFVAIRPASSQEAQRIARALESRYHGAATLKAVFFERFSDGNGGIAAESGTVYFSRPGRMRWEYESPQEKLFLVDGTNAWFYVPADHTASRARVKDSSDWRTPLALLAGKADLPHLCREIEIVGPASAAANTPQDAPASAEDTLLRCFPRSGSGDSSDSLHEILFETDPQSYLVRVVIREAGNLETEFRFANWQENIAIPELKFHFVPPPGVAIVDEATLAGAIH